MEQHGFDAIVKEKRQKQQGRVDSDASRTSKAKPSSAAPVKNKSRRQSQAVPLKLRVRLNLARGWWEILKSRLKKLEAMFSPGKKYMGARDELAPEMPKRAPKFCIEFNAKQIKVCYFLK